MSEKVSVSYHYLEKLHKLADKIEDTATKALLINMMELLFDADIGGYE